MQPADNTTAKSAELAGRKLCPIEHLLPVPADPGAQFRGSAGDYDPLHAEVDSESWRINPRERCAKSASGAGVDAVDQRDPPNSDSRWDRGGKVGFSTNGRSPPITTEPAADAAVVWELPR